MVTVDFDRVMYDSVHITKRSWIIIHAIKIMAQSYKNEFHVIIGNFKPHYCPV